MEESKNQKMVMGVAILILGMALGWFLSSTFESKEVPTGYHQMPNGELMANDGSMQGMMHDMMSGLAGKTGDEFDKAFLSEMIVHHQGAVDMANAVLANSKRPELIKLSNEIISAQTKEIEMMQTWQKAWFK